MIRYVKQNDESSCGPVALINTLKWLGLEVSYKSFIHIARHLCKWEDARCRDGGGTEDENLQKALDYFNINYKVATQPSLKRLNNHLDSGGAAIIGYFNIYSVPGFKMKSGHFTLCISRTSRTYTMVNDRPNNTITKRYKDTMRAILKSQADGDRCKVWFISK